MNRPQYLLCVRYSIILLAPLPLVTLGSACPGREAASTGATADVTYIQITDPDTDVAAYAEESTGALLAAIADKNADGDPVRLKGAYYREPSGREWALFLGSDGLPSYMTCEGWTFVFENYTSATVDVSILSPDGTAARFAGIQVDSEELQLLSDFMSSSSLEAQRTVRPAAFKDARLEKGIAPSDIIKYGATALSVAGCATAVIGATTATGGLAFPIAVWVGFECFQAGVAIGNLVWPSDESSELAAGLSLVECAAGAYTDNPQCTGLAVDAVTKITEALEDSAAQSAEQMSRDSDGDGVPDYRDNCASTWNPTPQVDTDGDGLGDQCDPTPFGGDLCPSDPNKTAPGVCGCGVADTDTDGDGTPDCIDPCPDDPNKIAPGVCGCGVADTDADSDGTPDCNDQCDNDPNKKAPGVCGCGNPEVPGCAAPGLQGKVCYIRSSNNNLYVMDVPGGSPIQVPLPAFGSAIAEPQWSFDGEWITFYGGCGGCSQIYVVRPDGSGFFQVTSGSGDKVSPSFSPDGLQIVFNNSYATWIRTINVDGTNMVDLGVGGGAPKWSPDGTRIVFTNWGRTYESDLFMLDLTRPRGADNPVQVTPHIASRAFIHPAWSPNGQQIAASYIDKSPEPDQGGVCVMDADGSDIRVLSLGLGGYVGSFSGDGDFVVFGANDGIYSIRTDGTDLQRILLVTDLGGVSFVSP